MRRKRESRRVNKQYKTKTKENRETEKLKDQKVMGETSREENWQKNKKQLKEYRHRDKERLIEK